VAAATAAHPRVSRYDTKLHNSTPLNTLQQNIYYNVTVDRHEGKAHSLRITTGYSWCLSGKRQDIPSYDGSNSEGAAKHTSRNVVPTAAMVSIVVVGPQCPVRLTRPFRN